MPRKKSVKKSAKDFMKEADDITTFTTDAAEHLREKQVSWAHEYGIVRLYRAFEALMLDALVGAINNDTAKLTKRTGISFPKHLTNAVCEFLIVGNGYFDFKGRDGLIKILKDYVPDDHYVVIAVKKDKYREPLERMSTLRNYAAHKSESAKKKAKKAVNQKKMREAGAWLKKQQRFQKIVVLLKELAGEIRDGAPY